MFCHIVMCVIMRLHNWGGTTPVILAQKLVILNESMVTTLKKEMHVCVIDKKRKCIIFIKILTMTSFSFIAFWVQISPRSVFTFHPFEHDEISTSWYNWLAFSPKISGLILIVGRIIYPNPMKTTMQISTKKANVFSEI